jgi:hypothetical protein
MNPEQEPIESIESLRSLCAALDKRYQELETAQQGQNELSKRLLEELAANAKLLSGLEEICKAQALEIKELKKDNKERRVEIRTLTTTIRRLCASLDGLSTISGKGSLPMK